MDYISINLGLGDIFITRLLLDSHNLKYNLEINLDIIKIYRGNKVEYLNFVKFLIETLFQDRNIKYINNKIESNNIIMSYDNFLKLNFKSGFTNLIKYFPIYNHSIFNEKYIIFHTKMRFNFQREQFLFLEPLISFIKNFKTNHLIVILGERIVNNQIQTQCSIYNDLLSLKTNNNVIDLTEEKELLFEPDKETFLRDISIINKSDKIFGLGYGGNFGISWAFSDKFCYYVGNLHHSIIDFFQQEIPGSIHRDIKEFIREINKYAI